MTCKMARQLEDSEGRRQYPYRCPAGYLTIGVGRNLETRGLSNDEINYLLNNDIQECRADLQQIFGLDFDTFSPARQCALVDMRFNLGAGGFRTFQRMIRAIHNGDWDRAAMEALDSAWAEQVQDSRVDKIFVQLRDG